MDPLKTNSEAHSRSSDRSRIGEGPAFVGAPPLREGRFEAGFNESWQLRITDPTGRQSALLQFRLLKSHNGFRKNCEIWATLLEKNPASGDTHRMNLRQNFDLNEFEVSDGTALKELGAEPPFLRFGSAHLSPMGSTGSVSSKGRRLTWSLTWRPAESIASEFSRIPQGVRTRLKSSTLHPLLAVSGSIELDGRIWHFENALGLREHQAGQSLPESWIWGQAPLVNSAKQAVGFIEASRLRNPIFGPIHTPALSTFWIRYQGRDFRFVTLWESLRARSSLLKHHWQFQVEKEDLRFTCSFSAELKDLAGLCYEDTNGSLAYVISTGLARMNLIVYRRGKLESTFQLDSGAHFEIGTRKPDPYVPLLS